MVVGVEPGLLERAGPGRGSSMPSVQQVSSPSAFTPRDHLERRVEHVAVLELAPGRAHAEALRARGLGPRGRGEHRVDVHQLARP